MIAAQQRLDAQSEVYLSSSSSPRPLPALFRLPRLKAQMKFAMEKKGEEEINLLFYSSTEAASTLQQHTLDFEVVAVPPPPESGLAPGPFVPLLPRIDLVLDRGLRQAWLDAILDHDDGASALGLARGATEEHARVLLWELVRPGEDVAERVVLAARAAERPPIARLGLVQLGVADGRTSVAAVQPLPVGVLDTWLGEFLRRAGARQAEIAARRPR
jgi:hypothetical protein